MKRLRFDPLARAEIDVALADSLARDPREAARLRRVIDRALALIRTFPQIAAVTSRQGDRRYVLGHRLPYSIVYVDQQNDILVVAFPHDRRRPGYWRHRITP